jgi:nicotinamide-nucleotide amidase
MLPSKAKIFPNEVGTAQGMLFETESFALVSMPGVPTEMKYIVQNSVVKYVDSKISEKKHKVQVYRTIKTAGIGESDLAELIGELDFLDESSLAFLPSYRGVKLRIGTESNSIVNGNLELDRIQEYIISKIGSFVTTVGDQDLTELVGDLLKKNGETLSVAESCTGGGLGAAITDIAGSSAYFEGGIISYSNEVKKNSLGVKQETLDSFGAVSEQTAIEMAKGVRKKLNSDYGISITGIAGPGGGTEEKPVGTVWIGLSDKNDTFAKKFVFSKSRQRNREISIGFALTQLFNKLKNR